jgi:integrase/recombinase XerD
MSSALLDQYLAYVSIDKGLSAKSLEAYTHDLGELFIFLHSKGRLPTDPGIESQLVLFMVHLHQKGLSSRSLARKVSSLRGFFKFLHREGFITEDPTHIIDAPKIGFSLPNVLSLKEIEEILSQPDVSHAPGKRDRAMLEVLYGGGLRESELIGLLIDDFNRESEFLRVVGKGGKERIVPIGRFAVTAVEEYLQKGRPSLVRVISNRTLFLNNRGSGFSRMGVWKLVRKYAVAAGVVRPVSPHVFRHSCATHMLEGGASILAVQEMLGHADVATTQIYTHLTGQDLKRVHAQAHPRGK